MTKHKTHEEIKAELLKNPEVKAAYEEEGRREKLRAVLAEWRSKQNLTSADVAQRMGVTPPTVNKMEKNVTKASIDTLYRYARACGVDRPLIPLY